MTSRHARHDLHHDDDPSSLDTNPPLLCLYNILYRMETEGTTQLPVRIPLTAIIDFFFIRGMYTMEPRLARPGESVFPPPLMLIKKPAKDLNSHVLLQELVEHDWNRRLDPDELSDDETDRKVKQTFAEQERRRDEQLRANLSRNNASSGGGGGGGGGGHFGSLFGRATGGLPASSSSSRGRSDGYYSAGSGDDDDEKDVDHYGVKHQAAFNADARFRDPGKHSIWAQVVFFNKESRNIGIDFLGADGVRDLLRNARSRKQRCIITQFLPPDDTAPPKNECVVATFAGQNFFRMERRVNRHHYQNPSLSWNERGACDLDSHSDEVQVPSMMRAKIEDALRGLVQAIEHYTGKRVINLRVAVKFRRGAVWLLHGEELVFFDRSVPRLMDSSILLNAAAPSARMELRRKIRYVTKKNLGLASPQSLAQSIIHELAVARSKNNASVLRRSPTALHTQASTANFEISDNDDDIGMFLGDSVEFNSDVQSSSASSDLGEEDMFLTKEQRQRKIRRKRAARRARLTKDEAEALSAVRWLRGEQPLMTKDDYDAIDLLRYSYEEHGLAAQRLSQFKSHEGTVAPSLLFLLMKRDLGSEQSGAELERFWEFRERLLAAKVDASLRKALLSNLREGVWVPDDEEEEQGREPEKEKDKGQS